MAISVVDGFNVTSAAPVDARFVFTSSAALWSDDDNSALPAVRRYLGMEVYIVPLTCSFTLVSGISRIGGGIASGSWITGSATSSYSKFSSYAETASTTLTASYLNATASHATSASYSDVAVNVLNVPTASSALTASYFYRESGSGAWKIYVHPTYGDLIFEFS